MNTTLHLLAEDYLRRLEQASWSLPSHDRAELLAEIRGHLQAGLTPESTDADVRNLLDELGTPEDIVAAAQASPDGAPVSGMPTAAPQVPASPWGAVEIVAVLALTLGTFVVPIIGPIVGIVLVWASTRWTHREKTVATILTVLPVIVLAVGAIGLVSVRSSGSDQPLPVEEHAPVVVTETGAP
ncbi:MAG: hypothetical protein ABJA93_04125 [Sporichthyaceae bacterium]